MLLTPDMTTGPISFFKHQVFSFFYGGSIDHCYDICSELKKIMRPDFLKKISLDGNDLLFIYLSSFIRLDLSGLHNAKQLKRLITKAHKSLKEKREGGGRAEVISDPSVPGALATSLLFPSSERGE